MDDKPYSGRKLLLIWAALLIFSGMCLYWLSRLLYRWAAS
jgi:hypothetical protein